MQQDGASEIGLSRLFWKVDWSQRDYFNGSLRYHCSRYVTLSLGKSQPQQPNVMCFLWGNSGALSMLKKKKCNTKSKRHACFLFTDYTASWIGDSSKYLFKRSEEVQTMGWNFAKPKPAMYHRTEVGFLRLNSHNLHAKRRADSISV